MKSSYSASRAPIVHAALMFLLCLEAAIASDAAVKETARRTGWSVSEMKGHLTNCDADQTRMNVCAEYSFVEADIQMNREYWRLVARKEERSTEKLTKSQRAWLRLRDVNCDYESSDLDGGTLRAAIELSCKKRMTGERTEWIREMLSCTSVRGECRSADLKK